jgi:hypothetical protein
MVKHFLPDFEHMEHQKTMVLYHTVNAIKEYAFVKARWSPPPCLIDPLEVKKSELYPLPALPYNQSDLDGVYGALKKMMQYVGWDSEDIDRSILVAGDLFTVERTWTLKHLLHEDESRFERLEWAVPVFQLFHLQMIVCNTILKTHWGTLSTPGSLAYLVNRLDRRRIYSNNKSHFYSADQFL